MSTAYQQAPHSESVENSCQHRARAPVFIVGCARSGNTLLYHSLLSSGTFAHYRGEPAVFDLIAPRFGSFASQRNRERMVAVWLRSRMFRISGLDHDLIREKMIQHCRSRGDFLRIMMDEVARSQGVSRWAVWGPDNLLCMELIKAELPDALFIHVIRDGRDVALSLAREGWIRPMPWDRKHRLSVAALHWRWKVEHGLKTGPRLGDDYMEVRFEDLVTRPEPTLDRIGVFIGQELDAEQIRQRSVGTLSKPNSTFQEEIAENRFQPVERWRRHLGAQDLRTVELAAAPLLQKLGYRLTTQWDRPSLREKTAGQLYPRFFAAKRWLKFHTFLGRITSVKRLQLTE